MPLFEDKAPGIMAALMRDLGLKDFQAAGLLGNLGWESAGFEHLQQIKGSAVGWAQWDGSRKNAFLAWAAAQRLDWRSDEANYRYLVQELHGSERAALNALLKTATLTEASDTFEAKFERAGVPALAGRRAYAHRALDAYERSDKRPLVLDGPPKPPPPKPVPPAPTPVPKAATSFWARFLAWLNGTT